MIVWVDTSGFVAVLNSTDEQHAVAEATWKRVSSDGHLLVTSSYVLLETLAVLQRLGGMDPVRRFQAEFVGLVAVEWVGQAVHEAAMAMLLEENRRQLSLVDCVSFVLMRDLGVTRAFAFDKHYEERGFTPP